MSTLSSARPYVVNGHTPDLCIDLADLWLWCEGTEFWPQVRAGESTPVELAFLRCDLPRENVLVPALGQYTGHCQCGTVFTASKPISSSKWSSRCLACLQSLDC